MSERIDKLREAVETMHKCKARHVSSEPTIELFRCEVAWDGVVETFDLEGHPKAKRCYAWSFVENGEPKYTTALEFSPSIRPRAPSQLRLRARLDEREDSEFNWSITDGAYCGSYVRPKRPSSYVERLV